MGDSTRRIGFNAWRQNLPTYIRTRRWSDGCVSFYGGFRSFRFVLIFRSKESIDAARREGRDR